MTKASTGEVNFFVCYWNHLMKLTLTTVTTTLHYISCVTQRATLMLAITSEK